jgi:hypothetical protein
MKLFSKEKEKENLDFNECCLLLGYIAVWSSLHGAIFQKMATFKTTAVRASNPTQDFNENSLKYVLT